MSSFNDFNLSEEMVAALAEKGFTSPSPIQALVIPELVKQLRFRFLLLRALLKMAQLKQ